MRRAVLMVVAVLVAPWCLARAATPVGVAGVEVVLALPGAEPRAVVTDASGAFVFEGVAAGPATLRFSSGLADLQPSAVSWTVEDASAAADARKAKDPKGKKDLRAEELRQGVAFDLETGAPVGRTSNLNLSKSNVDRSAGAPASAAANLNSSKSNVNRSAGPAPGGPLTVRGTVTAAAAPAPAGD